MPADYSPHCKMIKFFIFILVVVVVSRILDTIWLSLCFRVAAEHDELYRIITCVLNSDDQVMIMQFLHDCTAMLEIIGAVQVSDLHC